MKIVSPIYFRDQYINEIIENFNWGRVHRIMTYLNWNWWNCGIPTIEELKNNAIKLLIDSYEKTLKEKSELGYTYGSGGLEAYSQYDKNLNKVNFLQLQFVLTNWESDCDMKIIEEEKKYKKANG